MATIKAGTYKLSKTPNLINNSKAGTTEDIATDNTVFIKDTVIYNGTEIECNGKGIQITWAGVKSSGVSAKGSIEIVNATPNDYMWRISEARDGSSYQYRFANLTAPTDEQFDKVLTITLLSDVTVSQDLYDWWTANTTSQTAKLSVDLTALPGWTNLVAGNHTIKIKAKGTGYKDSELSAGVTVSKAASTVTLEAGTYKFIDSPTLPTSALNEAFDFASGGLAWDRFIYASVNHRILYSDGGDDTAVYYNNAWANTGWQTITLATDQTVSAEFYNWAITQGNLVKYEETYLLNTTLSMPSTATYYALEKGYKIGDSIYDSICIGYNNGKELRIAWRDDDSGDLMWDTLYNSSGWLSQSNRGLTLLKEPAPAFLTWLQANSIQPV